MTAPVMTGDELAATPPEHRFYECQDCKQRGTDPARFKMIQIFRVGFVICRECLEKP
ncbi:hypothetical protein BJ960_000847 [Leucobacter aridicollis]|uniref:Uncharacterized protein n=1 Tax=Leucobacter aridicollis TaxID=283878 RepID=A0A852RCG9_9MICO|nr:hypothetical protein [Leucobacter aridicollis]